MINEIILHKIENSETDYVCDITSVIDEYIVKPKDNRCVSYLIDVVINELDKFKGRKIVIKS